MIRQENKFQHKLKTFFDLSFFFNLAFGGSGITNLFIFTDKNFKLHKLISYVILINFFQTNSILKSHFLYLLAFFQDF